MQNAPVYQQGRLFKLKQNVTHSLRQMLRADTITSNIVAIGLCGVIAILMRFNWLFPYSSDMHHYVMIALEVLIAIQIIKSSKRSLLLPAACITISVAGLFAKHFLITHIPISASQLQMVMLIGIIGACISILNI